MPKTLSLITAATVAFVLVLVTVAHACVDMGAMNISAQQSVMSIETSDSLPCDNKKTDFCESVRDRLLSMKPSSVGADDIVDPLFLISTVISSGETTSPNVVRTAFHPVFKLSLSFSYLVLRI